MFSFFKKKPPNFRGEDWVWKTKASKYRGVHQQATNSSKAYVLLITFFEQSLKELDFVLSNTSTNYQLLQEAHTISNKGIYILPDGLLASMQSWLSSHTGEIEVVFVEHYPLLSRETSANELLNSLQIQHNYAISLESPLMTMFGGERIGALLENMGLEKDECISHKMVSTAIERAQKKISTQVARETPSVSIEEWMKCHFP